MTNKYIEVAETLKKLGVMYAEVEVELKDSYLDYYPNHNGSAMVGDYEVTNHVVGDDMWRYVTFENKTHKEIEKYLQEEL